MSAESSIRDGGWGWVIVACSFCLHFLTDGVTYAFGVLAVEFVDNLGCSRQLNGWITSTMVSVTFCGSPLVSMTCTKFGWRFATMAGSVVAAAGFAASFFVTRAWPLVITVGCVTGIGMSLSYLPAIVSVGVYFEKRRSTAIGIAACGSGIGTLVFGPLINLLIDVYSWRGAVLLLSGAMLQCAVFGSLLRPFSCRSNTEQSPKNKEAIGLSQLNGKKLFDLSLIRNAAVMTFCFSVIFSCVGYSAPFLYTPDRAQRAGHSAANASLLISVVGGCMTLGRVAFGFVADIRGVSSLALRIVAMTAAGLSLIFSFASDAYAFMVAYCAVFGCFIGASTILAPLILVDLAGLDSLNDSYGISLLFQGAGILLGPPIAGFIYDTTSSFDLSFMCGSCLLLSSLIMLPLPWIKRCQFGASASAGAA